MKSGGQSQNKLELVFKSYTHYLLYLLLFVDEEGVLAMRRIFSLVDMMPNTQFSNCPNVVKHQNTFQSDSSFTKPCKLEISLPPPSHFTSIYEVPFRPDFEYALLVFK